MFLRTADAVNEVKSEFRSPSSMGMHPCDDGNDGIGAGGD
jgi:hypothetical protein